ncbi:hypothetical protein ACF08M_27315 [Streptomyces sp. NPDC015032]|uniref:hypothetical protein n=1 Tax=Streptomyces sp. NPDC015032 TaxID=3364937 RepID=UPI0036FCE2EF
MAAPRKSNLVLEAHYDVKAATVLLGLATEDPKDKRGQKWLRDGVNQTVAPFPHTRMAGRLVFTESHLAEISARHESRVHGNTGKRKRRTASRRPVAKPTSAAGARQVAGPR